MVTRPTELDAAEAQRLAGGLRLKSVAGLASRSMVNPTGPKTNYVCCSKRELLGEKMRCSCSFLLGKLRG